MSHEGSGFQQFDQGWEIGHGQVDNGFAGGLRWRQEWKGFATQVQFWANAPREWSEEGDAAGPLLRQTDRVRMALDSLMGDVRLPLVGSAVEAVVGVHLLEQSFRRRNIVFNQVSDPATPHEVLDAAGAYLGAAERKEGRLLYGEWEATVTHFFFTHNRIVAEGGGIHREGYAWNARLEGGVKLGSWRLGGGYLQQIWLVSVPAGKALSTGAEASLPINKTGFKGPFLEISYAY